MVGVDSNIIGYWFWVEVGGTLMHIKQILLCHFFGFSLFQMLFFPSNAAVTSVKIQVNIGCSLF